MPLKTAGWEAADVEAGDDDDGDAHAYEDDFPPWQILAKSPLRSRLL